MNSNSDTTITQAGNMFQHCLRLWLIVAFAATFVPAYAAGDEATTATTATAEPTTATEISIFAPDVKTPLTTVLLGEKVSLDEKTPNKGPFPPLAELTMATVGGTVADFTSQGLTISDTAALVAAASIKPPDVVIVFAGYTDEQQNVDDQQQRVSLTTLVKNLRAKNPAMRIFLVPASTTVGALVSANLRLVAGDTNATFVPLGTEVSGEPYQEALQVIKTELSGSPNASAEQPAPAKAVYIQGKNSEMPVSTPSPASPPQSRPSKAQKLPAATPPPAVLTPRGLSSEKDIQQQELDRIAGEAGNAQTLPAIIEIPVTTTPQSADEQSTYPVGGTMTKRGAAAQEQINMRPLPAMKAFRPQIPVPRNDVNKKAPAISR